MFTVAPMASPTIITVSMCMTCDPTDTAVVSAHGAEPADDEQVRHAVKRLQKIREQVRQGEPDDIAEHAALSQIPFHKRQLLFGG